MPPQPVAVPAVAVDLYDAYLAWLARRGVGNKTFYSGARVFFAAFPDPQTWADLPLARRLAMTKPHTGPLFRFLMLHGWLRPGYDYLIERKLSGILDDAALSPLGPATADFLAAAERVGYSLSARRGMASQVAVRVLIETGETGWGRIGADDFASLEMAVGEREARSGRALLHYRQALFASRVVIYHLGAPAEPVPKRSTLARWSWARHLEGVQPAVLAPMVAYLERLEGTLARSSVQGTASELAHFGRFLAKVDPALESLSALDRRRHIEPYLTEVASARNHRLGTPITASTRRSRIQTVGRMFESIAEWGWPEAPERRLIFERDTPRLPHPLPRYLPPDQDRRLTRALEASPNRLRADALLVLRSTGLRIGELIDLELDCVHEVPGQGAWLKVPLGKLATERMVPLDDDTVAILDRIAEHRSPGRPLRHPRDGRLVDFLLTHQGRRLSACTLRDELHRAAGDAGLDPAPTPHQLRHTYATALVNAGCSLQALMALLGHVSAAMSLRYGRLFDATVREEYERALVQAKSRISGVVPVATPVSLNTDWRSAPLIKARLAGGYCVRTLAQESCPYANICEHCPNFRTEATFLPVLATQRTDTEALVADAEARGWDQEAARHRRLLERLDGLIARADSA